MTNQVADDVRVFHVFSLCTAMIYGQTNWQSLLYQLHWGSVWTPCPRLSTTLDFLITIGAIEKMGDAKYRRTKKGFDIYGVTKYKDAEDPLSGITYMSKRIDQ